MKKELKLFLKFGFFALFFVFFFVGDLLANNSWFDIVTEGEWGGGFSDDPVNYLKTVLEAIIGLAGLIAAGFIVFGAYTLITSSGEPENISKGQKMVTNAIIGLVIAALAFLIVNFVITEVPRP